MVVCMNGVDHVLTKEQAGLRKDESAILGFSPERGSII